MCIKEKAQEKKQLIEKNKSLKDELNQLENRAEELTVSLKNQADTREEMISAQRVTQENIQRLLDFINGMKGEPARKRTSIPPSPVPSSPSPTAFPSPSPTIATVASSPPTPAIIEISDGS